MRIRVIEDLPNAITPAVTEHTLHWDSCPHCGKDVEPIVPVATLGQRLVALTS